MKYTIEDDPERRTVTITDESGERREFQGVVLLAGDVQMEMAFTFAAGASADVAWAALQSFRLNDKGMRNFWKQTACYIAQAINPVVFLQEISADEADKMWPERSDETEH